MADEKKKPGLAALMVGMGKPKLDEAPEAEMGNDEDEEGYSASVDELFDALKGDDREGFSQAFKAAVMSLQVR